MPVSPQLVIGGGDRERLAVSVLGYERPDSTDVDDGNWLTCRVDISVGGFEGRFDCCLCAEDFVRFAAELRRVYEDLGGTATFDTMEEQLRLRLTGDGLGHFECRGEVRDQAGVGNRLEWTLQVDQTQIRGMINHVDAIVQQFPIRGP